MTQRPTRTQATSLSMTLYWRGWQQGSVEVVMCPPLNLLRQRGRPLGAKKHCQLRTAKLATPLLRRILGDLLYRASSDRGVCWGWSCMVQ